MKTIIGLIIATLLLFPAFVNAQAPSSMAGDGILTQVTSGTYPLASYGYSVFLPADSGNSYQLIGIYGVADNYGTYSFTNTGFNTCQAIAFGIFITLKGYTADARDLAAQHNIALLEEPDVIKLMDEVNWKFNPAIRSILNDTKKRCPKCEREMVLRTATKGANAGAQFWGCSGFPTCRFVLKCS